MYFAHIESLVDLMILEGSKYIYYFSILTEPASMTTIGARMLHSL